jgi:acyl-CoA synthetase (AMP-forming)/AMP-acid ligase II
MPEDTAPDARTLVELLRRQAERHRDKVAFRFCPDGGEEHSRLTYHELDIKARAIASTLQQRGAAGQRVLVICRSGLDSIAGFFGCVYAGAAAVPVHERLGRLTLVVPDAHASFALATSETQAKVKAAVDGLVDGRPLQWYATDEVIGDAENWVAPDVDASATALVQYTSGSTKSPKGTVVTHGNLLHNLEAIRQAWHGDDQAIGLYWLPQHHDMGLIGGVLEMLYVGCTTVLMSPTAFITRPIRWLKAMSRHHATTTAAPNFAYDKCVERTNAKQRAVLDLSSLSTAMNGAEPVNAATLQRFAEAFAPAGFRPEAFNPVYGLAEATLLVSGGSDSPRPVVRHLDRTALQEDSVIDVAPDHPTVATFVGCGRPRGGQDVVIVDPETRRPCGADEVGEIWIAGPSVAQGYLGRPKETEQTFSAFLSETGEGPFLRTGDLGFLRSDELFITGRCKDLIIIRGGKYYPNDIEITVHDCHPALLRGRGAVFAVTPESGAAEQLVVVQEVDRNRVGEADLTDVVDAIRAAITDHHGIQAHTVVLVEPMRIPTTSSGKIQRGNCRQHFLDGDLEAVAEWQAPSPPDDHSFTEAKNLEDAARAAAAAALIKTALARQFWASGQA